MKTKFLSKLIIAFLFLSFFSCDEEPLPPAVSTNIQTPQTRTALSIEVLGKSEIDTLPQLNQKLEEVLPVFAGDKWKKLTGAHIAKQIDLDIGSESYTVHKDRVLHISEGDYHSYTFPLLRNSPTTLVENLLLSLNENGEYDAFVVTYDLDREQKLKMHSGEQIDVLEHTTYTPIEDFDARDLISNNVYRDGNGSCYRLKQETSRATGWTITIREPASCGANGTNTGYGDEDPWTGQEDPGYGGGNDNPDDHGYGGGGSGGSGGGSGSSVTGLVTSTAQKLIDNISALTYPQREYLFNNSQLSDELVALLDREGWSENTMAASQVILRSEMAGIEYLDLDSGFLDIVNNYNSFNINSTNSSQVHIWYIIKSAELRALHPEWGELRIAWEASKEFIHLTLDVLGLVPGVGEVADLINGSIYFAEGDSVNGTLSLSAAIPFAGWTATGAKWAIAVAKLADGTKIALQLTKRADGLLDFGRKSSNVFRKQLGLTVGDGIRAHHVIPWNLNDHPVVQAAAKFKWHPHNAAINGKAVSSARHSGSHFNYDNYVRNQLESLKNRPDVINNPEKAYNEVI